MADVPNVLNDLSRRVVQKAVIRPLLWRRQVFGLQYFERRLKLRGGGGGEGGVGVGGGGGGGGGVVEEEAEEECLMEVTQCKSVYPKQSNCEGLLLKNYSFESH